MSDSLAVQMLETVLAELRAMGKRIEDQRGLKDSVIQMAMTLERYHAEELERIEKLEKRVDEIEEPLKGAVQP